jgi:hypothetical protein
MTVLLFLVNPVASSDTQVELSILQIDLIPPVYVDSPQDVSYLVHTTNHQIIWQPTYGEPHSFASYNYHIYRNGTSIQYGHWGYQDGGPITVVIDDLSPGVYNYTIFIFNYYVAKDTVLVTVYGLTEWPVLIVLSISFLLVTTIYVGRKFRK